jgi:hypothetical protein
LSNFFSLLRRLPVLMVTILLLISCVRSIDKMPPPLEFEGDHLNNEVTLHALAQENSFKTTDILVLRLTFRTDTDIVFPNDYSLRLFVRDKDSWKEINEKPVERLPEGDFIFSPDTSHQLPVIFVEPNIENTGQKYSMRIYVSGNMIKNGTSETVASYLDIELRP